MLARAGIGTNHLDGNTRLCTATAAEALKQTFGCDGQPGSYEDIDHADVIALYGHNMAETQTVLWTRGDRLPGPEPPRLVCVDPRHTPVARQSAVHLAPRAGTNLALLNALLHEIIRTDRIDRAYLDTHTVGFAELAAGVEQCPPRWAARICDVPAASIEHAAEIAGGAAGRAGPHRQRGTSGPRRPARRDRTDLRLPRLRRRPQLHGRRGDRGDRGHHRHPVRAARRRGEP